MTVFLEARLRTDDAGRAWSDAASLAGDAWRSDLPPAVRVRLAARADRRDADGWTRVEGELAPLPHYVGLRGAVRALPALARDVRRLVAGSSAVVVHQPGVIGLLAVAAATLQRRPVVVHVVGDVGEVLRSGVAGRAGRWLAGPATGLTRFAVRRGAAVRYVTRDTLQGRYPAHRDAEVVSLSDVVALPGDRRTTEPGVARLVAVGSQETTYKGHDVLLRAMAGLTPRHPDLELVLVGGGRRQPDLRRLAERLGLAERVRFAGVVTDRGLLAGLLDDASVFVLPSLTEGLPRALVEAMGRGLPCVASAVGGVPELLDEHWCVPPGDDDALAQRVEELLVDPELRQTVGTRNLDKANQVAGDGARRQWRATVAGVLEVRSRRPHVLHVIGSLDVGGAEMCALALCEALPEVRQTFVCLSGREGALADRFRAAGAEVLVVPLSWRPSFVLALARALRRTRPDLVQSHVSLASGPVLAVARLCGVRRRIARLHLEGDTRPDTAPRRAYRFVAGTLLGLSAQRILGVSHASLRLAAEHGVPRRRIARRLVLVPNGVDLNRFRPGPARTDDGVRRALHIGRAAPEKNRGLLAPIHRELSARGTWRTVVVGAGGTADIADPLPAGMSALGPRSDVPDLLRDADVLLLPSLSEGLPGVILEALATGVPVVASDLPTLRELADRLPGLTLVGLGRPPGAWADAVVAASASRGDPRLRAAIAGSDLDLAVNVGVWRELWSG